MSEDKIQNFKGDVINFISELKEQKRIAEIDLLYLFSYTLDNYSIKRYLNNQTNIINLLEKIFTQLLVLKYSVGNKQQALSFFRNFRNLIIKQFNEIIKSNRNLFYEIRNCFFVIITEETLEIISDFTKKKLMDLEENLDSISFIIKVIESAVEEGGFYKLRVSESEYLKNITFLENSYPNPGDFYFMKGQNLEIDRLNMGTLNYLANHVLNKEYNATNLQIQITYKLTNTPINKMMTPSLTAKREHVFNFWKIGDDLVKLGLGYWYPYFTTMNDSRYNKDININFIIPSFAFDILNDFSGNLPEIKNFQDKLETFDYTKKNDENLTDFEVSHDQIKDFIATKPEMLEEGWILIDKEYRTGSVGTIDILFKNIEEDFLIVEVKKEIAGYEPVGQILSYINWVKNNMSNESKKVRGVIVCGIIHPQLKSAFEEANNPDLQVWKYEKFQEGFQFEKILEIEGKLCPFCGKLCSPKALNCPSCGDPF